MRVVISEIETDGICNEGEFTREELEDAIRYALSNLTHPNTGESYYISECRIQVEIEA